MVKAYHADETNLIERASAGGLAKQEAPALPRYVTCSYVDFLRFLIRKHGEDYLRTPEGDALRYVPDAAFVLPPARTKAAPLPPPSTLPIGRDEHSNQVSLFDWAEQNLDKYPALRWGKAFFDEVVAEGARWW